MVDLVNQYDPNAEASNFDALPNGTYEAEIIDSNREPISKDRPLGDCLNLCWKVVRGEFEGRLFWQRLNLWWEGEEKNPGQVMQIANSQFKSVRDATGVSVPRTSEDLHFRPCLVTYGPQKRDPNYSEVKAVKPLAAQPATQQRGQQSRPAQSSRPPAQGSVQRGGSTPWNRGAAQQQRPAQRMDDDIPF